MTKSQVIKIQVGEEVIELTGGEKEAFIEQQNKDLADQEARQAEALLLETEYKAKQDARASAITKLGEIAGLTKEELDAIL